MNPTPGTGMRMPALAAVVAVGALLAALFAVGLFQQPAAHAQQSGGGELSLIDSGGGGAEFSATIQTAAGDSEVASVTFNDAGSTPVSLDAGSYLLKPMASTTHGYMGWALASDTGECPITPTAGGAAIEVEMMAGDSKTICIYHEEGATDVSDLEGSTEDGSGGPTQGSDDPGDDGASDDGTSEDAQEEATPEAPATGTGTAGQPGAPVSMAVLFAGSALALGAAAATLAIRRRDGAA